MDELKEKLDLRYSSQNETQGGGDSRGGSGGNGGSTNYISVHKFEMEVDYLRGEIQDIKDTQEEIMERFKVDMDVIKSLLQNMGGGQADFGNVSKYL